MEIPAKVSVFNPILDMKGKVGTLIAVRDEGFYEVSLELKDRTFFTVLLPIQDTAIVYSDPLPQSSAGFDVER